MISRSSEPIAITGMGLVTSLGLDRESTWSAMCRGECGVGTGTALESVLTPDPGVGQVADEGEPSEPAGREVVYLRRAIREALAQANVPRDSGKGRRGLLIGTTLHGMRHGGRFVRTDDFSVLGGFLAGATLGRVAQDVGEPALACTTCSACSSGLASVSLARSLLTSYELDLAIAGGYDPISEYAYAGFNSMRLVSSTALRPFAADRDGMKVGEGYAIVILERADAAMTRGVKPLAYVLGMGESCDAFHLSKPHPEGAGAAKAILEALESARLTPADIDLIIAHGTATVENDAAEYAALKQVFGEHLPRIPLLATKSHLGHSLGAAGAVDLIVGAMAVRQGMIPPCANLATDAALIGALNPVRGAAKRGPMRHVLTVSLGFGGANVACVVGAEANQASPARVPSLLPAKPRPERRVAISGIGVVVPGGAGNEAFARSLANGQEHAGAPEVSQEELEPLINARRTRRMSEFAKLAVGATGEALRRAGVEGNALFCEDCAAILATMHGPTEFCESFYRQIVAEGPAAANPLLFAEGVPNVASAHLSTTFGIKGFCQTLIGSRTAGLDALSLAQSRIRSGEWLRAIVAAAEEYTPLLPQVYDRLLPEQRDGWPLFPSSGAVAFILESEESLRSRSGRPLAFIEGSISRHLATSEPCWVRRSLRDVADFMSGADAHCCARNGTWIGALERRTLPRCKRTPASPSRQAEREFFSVAPLVGLAGSILWRDGQGIPRGESSTGGSGRLGVVCADYFGSISAARVILT